jgi:hypothetical protein
MPSKVCVYTAVFAGYDQIRAHKAQSVECDFVVFTDDTSSIPPGYVGILTKNPGNQTSPVLKNVWLRLFPFGVADLDDYDLLIYIDANVRICESSFVEEILERYQKAGGFDLALSAHPWNSCLYQEAEDSQKIPKYDSTELARQVLTYRSQGFPPNAGLYWNGFMAYNRLGRKRRIRKFQNKYWQEMIAYNMTPEAHPQGQVSLPYCLWKSGLKTLILPQLYRSDTLEIAPHLR